VTLTGLSAGPRAAIYSAGFLSYMGFLGFWVKAMTTLALLGTAAILSIAIGIPLGIFCARRQRFYSMIRPIMDFHANHACFRIYDSSHCLFLELERLQQLLLR
jgi:glycine betaine/proline transport system permease protein